MLLLKLIASFDKLCGIPLHVQPPVPLGHGTVSQGPTSRMTPTNPFMQLAEEFVNGL